MKKGYLTYILPVLSVCMMAFCGALVMAEGTDQTQLAEECFSLNKPDSILRNHDALRVVTTVYDTEGNPEEKITTYLADLGMCITQYDSLGNLIRIDEDKSGIHVGGYEASEDLLYRMVFPDDETPEVIRDRYYELPSISEDQRILSVEEKGLDSGETERVIILTASDEEAFRLAGETFASRMQENDCWVELHTFGNGKFRQSVQYYIAPLGKDAGIPDPDRNNWTLVSESQFSMPDQYGELGEDFLYEAHDPKRKEGMEEGKTLKSVGLDIPKDADDSIREKVQQINAADRTMMWHVIDVENKSDTQRMETTGAGVTFVPVYDRTEMSLYQDKECTKEITAETVFDYKNQIAVYSRKGVDTESDTIAETDTLAETEPDTDAVAAADTAADPSAFVIVQETADIKYP